MALTSPDPEQALQSFLEDLHADDRAKGTIRRYRSAILGFLMSARQALTEYLAPYLGCDPTIRAVTRAWPPRSSHSASLPVWQSQKKGALTTSAMRQMIEVLVRDASARGLVPAATSAHTLRLTFARNYLAEHPGDIVGLAALLGHTSLETARIYSQPTIEQLATRVEQLRQNANGE